MKHSVEGAVLHKNRWHDHMRSCVYAGGGHFEHILTMNDSPEHFYEAVNCQCNLMHVTK